MKNFITFFAALALSAACSGHLLVNTPSSGSSQRDDPNIDWDPSELWKEFPFNGKDSVIRFAAIDSSGGKSRLRLYSKWEETLCLELGEPGILPVYEDLHHLVCGHIYSECRGSGETTICRDGKPVCAIGEGEYLIGILPKGNDLYLLSQKSHNAGFTLWKNGLAILAKDSGSVFGDLDEASYAPCGALYTDSGHYCFSYLEDSQHGSIFKDAAPVAFESESQILDARMFGGELRIAHRYLAGETWKGARLWDLGEGLAVATGESTYLSDTKSLCSACKLRDYAYPASMKRIDESGADMFYEATFGPLCIKNVKGGEIVINGSTSLEGKYEYLCSRCVKLMADGPVMALNPLDANKAPVLKYRNRYLDMNWIKGRVISLEAELSLPN